MAPPPPATFKNKEPVKAAVAGTADLPTFALRVVTALEQEGARSPADAHRIKQRLAGEAGLGAVPSNADLLAALPDDVAARQPLLRKKPARSLSGVAVVAVMSSPAGCPHGKCVYCPGGPEADAPQSYTGFEPSTMRAKRLDYDPYRVVRTRLGRLAANGHSIDKVELIVQGGTFPARDPAYQDWSIAMLYAACNDGPSVDDPGGLEEEAAWAVLPEGERRERLARFRDLNEGARCRVVGLTVETKPDWCLGPHLDRMLEHGTTRIELGLQCLDDEVLRLTHRGHTLQDARDAMRLARDAGFKVCVHMMPGLPRRRLEDGTYATDAGEDTTDLRRLFEEEDWRPDMLKVYPTLVVREGETPLKRWWREGRYTPFPTEAAADVLVAAKPHVPVWCRIQRIDRDIPTTHVEAGVMHSNLRQIVQARMAKDGTSCVCIRCREPGTRSRDGVAPAADRLALLRRDYRASGGYEAFLSLEDPEADVLVAFLRLRRVGSVSRPEFRDPAGAAVVRELKVYGIAQPLGRHEEPAAGAWQHRGLGTRLLAEAERIAFREWGVGRLLVIAGVGVKAYYRRHGFAELGPYVAKAAPSAHGPGENA